MKIPNEDKQYLIVRNPSDDELGAYYLIVDKPESGFGSSQVIYSVDLVQVKDGTVSGYLYDTTVAERVTKLVAQFPESMNYLVILKERAEFMTPEEVAEYNSKFGKRLRAAMAKHLDDDNVGNSADGGRGFSYL